MAKSIALMHLKNVIHGDLTTSNMMVDIDTEGNIINLYLIDFGLSSFSTKIEDQAVDLYVLKRALISLHPGSEKLFDLMIESYEKEYAIDETNKTKAEQIVEKYKEVEL